MKSRLVWLGLAAFLLTILAVFPVRWIAGVLPASLHCKTWSGSIWNGQCAGLEVSQPGSLPLQAQVLRWKLSPLSLMRLTLAATVEARTVLGSGRGQLELRRNGRMTLRDTTISTQFDRRLATMLPQGWNGRLEVQHLVMQLQGMQIQSLSGEMSLLDFNDGSGARLGSYRLAFPASSTPPFVGKLQDAGGPLEVHATLTITTDRRWQLEGTTAARAEATDALRRRLDILGAPDSNGSYRLAAEGSFK